MRNLHIAFYCIKICNVSPIVLATFISSTESSILIILSQGSLILPSSIIWRNKLTIINFQENHGWHSFSGKNHSYFMLLWTIWNLLLEGIFYTSIKLDANNSIAFIYSTSGFNPDDLYCITKLSHLDSREDRGNIILSSCFCFSWIYISIAILLWLCYRC